MPSVKIVKCIPLDSVMKKSHPTGFLHLEISKAIELQRRGLVKIAVDEKPVMNETTVGHVPGRRIPIIIPFEPEQKIGFAYNREMQRIDDWVIFIDYDVMILNPHWYEICSNAIDKVGENAGWITCYTNRIGCRHQALSIDDIENHDIRYHKEISKKMYEEKRGKIRDVTDLPGQLSGMFILTSKRAWQAVGGFKEDGFYGIDNDYSRKIRLAGLRLYVMEDLYVYHSYFRYVMKDGSENWR